MEGIFLKSWYLIVLRGFHVIDITWPCEAIRRYEVVILNYSQEINYPVDSIRSVKLTG